MNLWIHTMKNHKGEKLGNGSKVESKEVSSQIFEIRKEYSKMLLLGSFFHFTQREFRKCWTKTPQMDPTCKSVIATLKFPLILPIKLHPTFPTWFFSSAFVFFVNFRHLKCVQHFIPRGKALKKSRTLCWKNQEKKIKKI